MVREFANFLVFYLIMSMMFVMIGTLMFMYCNRDYSSLYKTFIIVLNASIGGSRPYSDFDKSKNENLQILGKIYLALTTGFLLIITLNLLIAILTNISDFYQDLSTGLFLSKILSIWEQFECDEYYGSFINAIVPFNIFVIPFIP